MVRILFGVREWRMSILYFKQSRRERVLCAFVMFRTFFFLKNDLCKYEHFHTAQDLMLLWYVDDIFSYTRYGFSSQLALYMYQ